MNTRIVALLICVLPLALYAADDAKKTETKAEGEYQRVLVFDKGSKPSVAAVSGHYEWRKISADCCGDCKSCMKETAAKKEGTKPAANVAGDKECVAYLCAHCGKLVWSEEGKEITKETSADEEVKAVKTITAELSRKYDGTTKPAVAARQRQ